MIGRRNQLSAMFALTVAMATFTFASEIEAGVVCDKFKIIHEVEGSTLQLSLETDMPDNTVIMVSVSRSYQEKGNSARYPEDYFSERSTVGDWRTAKRISIANSRWISKFREKREMLSRVGLASKLASIDNEIIIHMVVPINQPDPRFGKSNSNLTGKAVRTTGLRVVEDSVELDYPLGTSFKEDPASPSLDPQGLDVGQMYVVTRKTPVMPELEPVDPLAAIGRVKEIPKGGMFKVLRVAKKRGTPWYRVEAFSQSRRPIGTGWINSIALLGQKLEAYE